ncbi:MAG: hypothetical protein J6I49_07545 [Bacteroidales bacterium]|nr:hypothetical protein [Bacteroidales bacterium]
MDKTTQKRPYSPPGLQVALFAAESGFATSGPSLPTSSVEGRDDLNGYNWGNNDGWF